MDRSKLVCLGVLVVLCCSLFAVPAHSQSGTIGAYGDENMIECHIYDVTPGLVYVYIGYHQWTGSSLGTRFRVEFPLSLTYITEDSPFLKLGDALSGVTVCYESCLPSSTAPVLILRMLFFGSAITMPCSRLTIEPHPEDTTVQSLDCEGIQYRPTTFSAIVNPDATCWCQVVNAELRAEDTRIDVSDGSAAHFCTWVPVEQNTWGAIKSLYR